MKKSGMKQVEKKFNGVLKGNSSRQMQEHFIRDYFFPMSEEIFKQEPEAKAVIVAFGQFWADEGADAVHMSLLLTSDKSLKWHDQFNGKYNKLAVKYKYHYAYDSDYDNKDLDDLNQTYINQYGTDEGISVKDVQEKLFGSFWFDENESLSEAFADYCPPDCHQEMGDALSFAPYAYSFLNEDGNVEVKVIGIPNSFNS